MAAVSSSCAAFAPLMSSISRTYFSPPSLTISSPMKMMAPATNAVPAMAWNSSMRPIALVMARGMCTPKTSESKRADSRGAAMPPAIFWLAWSTVDVAAPIEASNSLSRACAFEGSASISNSSPRAEPPP